LPVSAERCPSRGTARLCAAREAARLRHINGTRRIQNVCIQDAPRRRDGADGDHSFRRRLFYVLCRNPRLRISAGEAETKTGDAEVAVRLVNKKSGKAVPDAVIFAKRIDMAPEGMATMASPLEQLPSTEPGVYRFKTKLSMQGKWQLSLGAKVQGENGSVESKLILMALP
jgi:hypothetical protein